MRYYRIFLLHFQNIFAQRGLSIVWFIMSFVSPVMMLLFWRGVKAIPGWTIQELTTYYLAVVIIGALLMTYIEERITNTDIKQGQLTMYLLKPFPYIWLACFYTLPNRFIQGGFCFIIFILLVIFYPSVFTFTHSPLIWFLSVFILIGGFVTSFLFKMIVATVAFWTTEAKGIIEITNAFIVVFGGYVMPLTLLPDPLSSVAQNLPFAYMVYLPVMAVIGKLTLAEVVHGLMMQIIWSVVLYVCYRKLWNAGIKKYSAIGQ
jgi:ABC-2 type transport system permease protein